MSACRQNIPPELEKEFVLVDMDLPERKDLMPVLSEVAASASIKIDENDLEIESVIDNARGMTLNEAENAFALSVVEAKEFCPKLIYREKSQVVKKSGLLEIITTEENIDSIGGLDLLKDYLELRSSAFTKEAKEFGLPTPKGLLFIGIPGTGKSLTAKVTSSILNKPILRMDAGKIFGSLVGESEANLRSIIKTAEAVAPCILFIDEIEKGFSGNGSGVTDGGTSNRVFGSFLTWLQEKTAPVFVVATANDISALRPEFLRTGRFDQIFFVDLPQKSELEQIWNIQIDKHILPKNIDREDIDISNLAESSDGYTGAEIEQAVIESMFTAYNKKDKIDHSMLRSSLKQIVPLSTTMHEQIESLRDWSKDRARPASSGKKNKSKKPTRKIKKEKLSDISFTEN